MSRLVLVAFLTTLVGVTAGPDISSDDLQIKVLQPPALTAALAVLQPCARHAKPGDEVTITHVGYVERVLPDQDQRWNGQVIERSREGEPSKFILGAWTLLRGMELAVMDKCVGDMLSVTMAPRLAFDDAEKNFPWKTNPDGPRPCPHGTFVRYEINITAVEDGPPAEDDGIIVKYAYEDENGKIHMPEGQNVIQGEKGKDVKPPNKSKVTERLVPQPSELWSVSSILKGISERLGVNYSDKVAERLVPQPSELWSVSSIVKGVSERLGVKYSEL